MGPLRPWARAADPRRPGPATPRLPPTRLPVTRGALPRRPGGSLPLHLDDLRAAAPVPPTRLERRLLPLLEDARDFPFLRLILLAGGTVLPLGAYLLIPGSWNAWLALLHVALLAWLLPPFTLMLHNTSHRRLFRRSHPRLGHVVPVVLG